MDAFTRWIGMQLRTAREAGLPVTTLTTDTALRLYEECHKGSADTITKELPAFMSAHQAAGLLGFSASWLYGKLAGADFRAAHFPDARRHGQFWRLSRTDVERYTAVLRMEAAAPTSREQSDARSARVARHVEESAQDASSDTSTGSRGSSATRRRPAPRARGEGGKVDLGAWRKVRT